MSFHRSSLSRPLTALLLLVCAVARAPVACADALLFSEVVTDPQGDHSENAGGNGLPFDSVPGSGTISAVDEFVEIYNSGDAPVDLTGYVIDFIDTSPSQYVFGTTGGGVLRISEGSTLDALLPGSFVVLGNPPGSLNNTITLELRDSVGVLVDTLPVPDGNASSLSDEAVTRIWSGFGFGLETARAPITPLVPPPPVVPEPGTMALVGLVILAGARASARRARRGANRTPPGSPPARTHRLQGGAGPR